MVGIDVVARVWVRMIVVRRELRHCIKRTYGAGVGKGRSWRVRVFCFKTVRWKGSVTSWLTRCVGG